jgi:CheY-like chemotaxis protein
VSARFVVVGAHAEVRESFSTLLADSGYTVLAEAPSVREAIAAAKRERPDVILIDREVPDVEALVSDDTAVVVLAAPMSTLDYEEGAEPVDAPELRLRQVALAAGPGRRVRLVPDDGGRPASEDDSAVLVALKDAFSALGWSYVEQQGLPVLLSELEGPLGRWPFYARVAAEHGIVGFYSICPERVPEERRVDAADFLTWVNHGLAHGNFELDFENGEVRFKTVMPIAGHEVDLEVVRRLVRANGLAMETYLEDIKALASGQLSRTG